MTPYYQDESVTIYHGDCREVLAGLRHERVGLLLTDPPYGIDLDTDNSSRGGNRFARIVGDAEPFDPVHLLAYDRAILFGANHYASRLPDSGSWIVWDKRDGVMQNTNADCELAWTNLGGPARVYRHLWAGFLRDSERGESRVHPTQKPVALMAQLIADHSRPGDLVLDPYMGSGATVIAAKQMSRRAIGIEIEERYCEVAATRCSQGVLGLTA